MSQDSSEKVTTNEPREQILKEVSTDAEAVVASLYDSDLRTLSDIVQDPEEIGIDERRLYHALRDVGTFAYGLQGIAVWVFDETCHRLVSPRGGFWYHPDRNKPSEYLAGLIDRNSSKYVPMVPVAPGTDIAGLLWLEASNKRNLRRLSSGFQRASSFGASTQTTEDLADVAKLTWRCLRSLVQDPDTAKGPRLVLLNQAGMGDATGIQFQTGNCSGMIIFFVQSDLDPEILNGNANLSYLRQSAQFIGMAAAMTEARRATVGQQLLKRGINDTGQNRHELPDVGDEEQPSNLDTRKASPDNGGEWPQPPVGAPSPTRFPGCSIPKGIQGWLSKFRGGDLQIPPSLSFRQALWTAFGAFCSLLLLSALNEYFKMLSDDEYFLLIGPFGALMTLQYGLTAAPASQPRNAIMGQAVAGSISLAFTLIPDDVLPTWLRTAVGPAIGIATMVKLGFTHPPAGAHAVLYASGKYNFTFYALVVLSTVVSIIPATLVNNMSRKRQYPTYWGIPRAITKFFLATEVYKGTKQSMEPN